MVGDTKPIPNNMPQFGIPPLSLVGSDDDDDTGFETLNTRRTWRYEVVQKGKYWIWRKGSGKKRDYRFGGKFKDLPKERRDQYYVNRAIYHAYRQAAAERDGRAYGAPDAGKRDVLL